MAKRPLLEILQKLYPEKEKKELYARILCGEVHCGGATLRDPQQRLSPEITLELVAKRYVSRGGYKLEAALSEWNISVQGALMLDAGSSTGGFTDCLLQRGAQGVYAVDVGYNQLDYKLRRDRRVTVMERTNIMELRELTPPPVGAVADLSFRSLSGAASRILDLTLEKWAVALIKPQFEWDSPEADFNGVVTDGAVIREIIIDLAARLRRDGVLLKGLLPSPIHGRKGNREYLGWLVLAGGQSGGAAGGLTSEEIKQIVH